MGYCHDKTLGDDMKVMKGEKRGKAQGDGEEEM